MGLELGFRGGGCGQRSERCGLGAFTFQFCELRLHCDLPVRELLQERVAGGLELIAEGGELLEMLRIL